jgi:hypothetical protein
MTGSLVDMHKVFEGICCLPLQGSLLQVHLEIKEKMFLGNVWANNQIDGLSPEYMISGFRREVDDSCFRLAYYAASNGNFLPTFRDNLSFPSSRGF